MLSDHSSRIVVKVKTTATDVAFESESRKKRMIKRDSRAVSLSRGTRVGIAKQRTLMSSSNRLFVQHFSVAVNRQVYRIISLYTVSATRWNGRLDQMTCWWD